MAIEKPEKSDITQAAELLNKGVERLTEEMVDELSDLAERQNKLNKMNEKLLKENTKSFSKMADEFLQQSTEMESMDGEDISDIFSEHLLTMSEISEKAATGNHKELVALKNAAISNLETLRNLELGSENEGDKLVIQKAEEQVDLLKKSTGTLDGIFNVMNQVAKQGAAVLVGIAGNSPLGALGVEALVNKLDENADKQALYVEEQIKALKTARKQISDQSNRMRDEFAGQVEILTELALDPLVSGNDEPEEMLEVLRGVLAEAYELRKNAGDTNDLLQGVFGGSEEERREALDRHRDLLAAMKANNDSKKKKEEEDTGLLSSLTAGAAGGMIAKIVGGVTGFLKGIMVHIAKLGPMITKVFSKNLPKILLKFVALPITILGGLASGISDAIDTWRNGGSIKDTIFSLLGGVLDFITAGFLNPEIANKIFGFIENTFNKLVQDMKSLFNLHGETTIEILKSALFSVAGGVKDMFMEFIDDMANIGRTAFSGILEAEWFTGFIDMIGSVFSAIYTPFDEIKASVVDLGITVSTKWQAFQQKLNDMIDKITEMFSFDNLKKKIPGYDMFFGENENPDTVTKLADSGVIDRNLIGDTEIMDREKLAKETSARDVQDLLALDDWSREDKRYLQDLLNEKLETADEKLVATTRQDRRAAELTTINNNDNRTELVNGTTKAETLETAQVALERTKRETEMKKEEAKRKETAANLTNINANTTNNNSSTTVINEKPFDTDPVFNRAEQANYVG